MHMEELVEYYLCIKITNPRTAVNYESIVKRFCVCCPHVSIQDIQYRDIKRWKNIILENASTTTWNTYLRHMKALFNFAFKKELIAHNPFDDMSFAPKITRCKKTIQNGTISEIIDIIQSDPQRYQPDWFWSRMTRFLYLTGIRRRQLVHIVWEHIDFEQQTLLICASGSKNYTERKIPLARTLLNDLRYLQRKHRELGRYSPVEQIFNITRFNEKYAGSTLKVDQITGFYKRLKKHTGISVSPHRFRHTMASQLGNIPNVNILTVSNILGHSDLRVTQEYVETDLRPQLELVKTLEQHLTKKIKQSQ